MNDLTISLIQIRANEGDIADKLREPANSIPQGTNVLLFPESWQDGAPEDSEQNLEILSGICSESYAFAISGGMPWIDGGEKFFRTWILGDSGEEITSYDKAHLSSKRGEDKIYSPGGPVIFNIGKATCAALSGSLNASIASIPALLLYP